MNALKTFKELSQDLNCNIETIRQNVIKFLPNKQIINGKTTYLNEEEVAVLVDKMKNNNNNQYNLQSSIGGITTSKDNQLKMYKLNEESKTLDIQQQIQLAFQMQANVIKTLNENNDLLKQINNDLTIKLDQNSEYYSIKEFL